MARRVLKLLPWLAVPAAVAAGLLHAPALVRFVLAGLALLPAAALLGEATGQLSARLGPAAAGVVNATCGNAAELIIAVLALRRGLVEVVQASLSGSIIGNLLLVLGAAAFAGGLRFKVQKFASLAAESQLGSLALAVFALLFPAVFFHLTRLSHREELALPLSVAVAVVLLVVYAAALVFSLRTHRHLLGGGHEGEPPTWSTRRALASLVGGGAVTALLSELLVGSVEEVGHTLGLGPVFLGVVVVAVLGNAAEHAAAVVLAWRNHMDAAISVCLASSLQVALFVTPGPGAALALAWPPDDPGVLAGGGGLGRSRSGARGPRDPERRDQLAGGGAAPRALRDPRRVPGAPARRRCAPAAMRGAPLSGVAVRSVVSGGQTGVDRAALDVARELGIPCGGWCPRGRRAEDGPIPEAYPVRETPSTAYPERTAWNVRDSDGTLVITRGKPRGGTALTVSLARRAAQAGAGRGPGGRYEHVRHPGVSRRA